jgi:hypothetical protein
MKAAVVQQPKPLAFHVRIFSQAELRTLLIMAISVGIVFDLFG